MPISSPAMAKRIEVWPIEKLVPYSKNARKHDEVQVTQIAASIIEFGFVNPILVDSTDGIIAGHGRLLAAKDLALKEVPVVVLDHLTEAQKKAYIIADNKIALNSAWDVELLNAEIGSLKDIGFDYSLLGFSEAEIDGLLEEPWDSDIDAMDNIEAKDSAAKGQIKISCNEWDKEQIREAITNTIDGLGLEDVDVS